MLPAFCLLPSAFCLLALGEAPPDPAELVRDAIALQYRVFEDLERRCFLQRILQEEPGNAPPRRREERLEEVCFRQGVPLYNRLTINGQPTGHKTGDPFSPPASEEDWRKRKERVAERRKRDRDILEHVPQAFHFQWVEETELEGRPVVVLDATPRQEFRATSRVTELLKHVTARVWIDRETHHMVWLKARVETDFNLWGGLVAKVRRGATFESRQKPFQGVWLPYFLEQRWGARVALFKNIGEHVRLERSEFRSQTSAAAEGSNPR